jgi:hypothetical protein
MKIAYAVWGFSVVFVQHPFLRGLYLKTHPCVVHVACPKKVTEGCGAGVGEPCKNNKGEPVTSTHAQRRVLYARRLKKGLHHA